jgi:hypothetical protein
MVEMLGLSIFIVVGENGIEMQHSGSMIVRYGSVEVVKH